MVSREIIMSDLIISVSGIRGIIGDRLGHIWGQQVVIVNQPGAGGAISAQVAALGRYILVE